MKPGRKSNAAKEELASLLVLERYIKGKRSEESCDDSVYTGKHFAAVIDGVSASSIHVLGDAPGKIAGEIICSTIDAFPPEITARDAVNALTMAIASDPRSTTNVIVPTAAISIVSRHRREIWQVGDTTFWETTSDVPPVTSKRPLDETMAHLRGAYLRFLLSSTNLPIDGLLDNDPGRDLLISFFRAAASYRNQSGVYGYGDITNTRVPNEYLVIHEIQGKIGEAEVIMHTDGYPVSCPTLEAAESMLSKLLSDDPLCIGPLLNTKGKNPKGDAYDDRAYLRVRL